MRRKAKKKSRNKNSNGKYNSCIFFLFSSELVNTSLENGSTGELLLNGNGDRINAVYQILNLKSRNDKELTVVGEYRDGQVSISEAITWPGGRTERPEGFLISTHLNVSRAFMLLCACTAVSTICSFLHLAKALVSNKTVVLHWQGSETS